jgi:hypothetical protein
MYGSSNLALLGQFLIFFSHGCWEEDYPCNIYYVHTLGSPVTLTRMFDYFFPDIMVLVLLPMKFDYFNGYVHTRCHDIAAEKKL